ncbi:MAG: hypothetical protein ACXWLH_03320 [Candidatus Saccharimonadales bacterium]
MTAGVKFEGWSWVETNMSIFKIISKFAASLLVGLLAVLLFISVFPHTTSAGSLSQGYHSSQSITSGTIVSLTKSGSNEIETTNSSNENLMLGVAVSSKNAIVDLQPSGSDIRVAISGEIPALVTNANGDIKAGDNLIISQIAGVAMKDSSSSNAKKFVGVASEPFGAITAGAKQFTVSQGGSDKNVYVGLIKVKILVSDRQSSVPRPNPFIAFVQNLTGRPVGTAQLIAAVAVFLTTFSFTGLLLTGSIKGAFVSLGRNPLSKPAIISNMARVSVVGLLILIVGVAMAYVILLI